MGQSIVKAIYAAREAEADNGFRPHLGASRIGIECSRALWYEFRWSKKASFSGRMLRLFETGQLAEPRFISDLRRIKIEVSEGPAAGEQWRFAAVDGHFGGSMDCAVCIKGEWMVGEFKTHSAKSFAELIAKGVAKSKPVHEAQMQVYMGLSGMNKAMYMAVNKDTDELHVEFIDFDEARYTTLMDKAKNIIYCDEPPQKLSTDPAFFQCKFCDYSSICHGNDVPVPTCRSCAHVTATKEGKWRCEFNQADTDCKGCDQHRYIPKLLDNFAEFVDADGHNVTYKNKLTGNHFNNGEGAANDYASNEIWAAHSKETLGDPMVEEIREEFGAKIVEAI
jgi:hypothetical protein